MWYNYKYYVVQLSDNSPFSAPGKDIVQWPYTLTLPNNSRTKNNVCKFIYNYSLFGSFLIEGSSLVAGK